MHTALLSACRVPIRPTGAPSSAAVALLLALCVAGAPATAASKKNRKGKAKTTAPAEVDPPTTRDDEDDGPARPTTTAPTPPRAEAPPVAPAPSAPATAAPAAPMQAPTTPAPTPAPTTPKAEKTPSPWAGFFFHFGIGYATSGGEAGPDIPDVESARVIIPLRQVQNYDQLVTTDVGSGLAVMLRVGCNILGYGSLWLDLSGHGNPTTDKKNLAGGGAVALMAGLHPLAFWRQDIPVDVQVYGGFAPIDILGYNENQSQGEYKGKGWVGTAIPFGLLTEWKPNIAGGFALGLDLRLVRASYDQWYFNWDREELSRPSPPVTTLRFEPRLTLGAHF